MIRPGIAGCALALLLAAGLAAGCSHSPPAVAHREPATPLDMSTVGAITGVVRFTGTPPAMPVLDMSGAPGCAPAGAPQVRDQAVVVNPNATLRWAFVYIAKGLQGWRFDPPSSPAKLIQQGCRFHPHVLGLMAGQALEISSRDSVVHNVHAAPRRNGPWNISMLPGAAPVTETFPQPEVMIPVECNVHAWMHAYVGVVDNPYFAVTGRQGRFRLLNVPPGHYMLAVWQQRYGLRRQEINLLPRQHLQVVFTYSASGSNP
ncbi:MAG: carboxypeptidase regulatory-like domain-containing protein [Terriglobales bacterium]